MPRVEIRRVLGNCPIDTEVKEGINEAGTMALCWYGDSDNVFGRGIRAGGSSCIFRGRLDESRLDIEEVVLDPKWPGFGWTHDDCEVVGYEDPTYDSHNHRLLCTQVFQSDGHNGKTNLIAYDLRKRTIRTLATPLQANRLTAAGAPYRNVDMIKEAVAIEGRSGHGLYVVELGAKNQALGSASRLALAHFDDTAGLVLLQSWLEPQAGSRWMDRHVSTGSQFMRYDYPTPIAGRNHTKWLAAFNGSHEVVDAQGKVINVWNVGLMLIDDKNGFDWISPQPIIPPPDDMEPGPHGQRIAFASDARGGHHRLEILYHANDRVPCRYEADIRIRL